MTEERPSDRLSRRRLMGMGAAASGAAALAACGQFPFLDNGQVSAQDDPSPTPDVATSGTGDVELSFLSIVGTSSPAGQARLAVMEKFAAEHDNVTINYEAIPYDQFFSQLVTRTLAGDAPSIAQDGHHTAQFAVNNSIVAFDEYMERDGVSKEDYWQALWALGDFGGKTWSMPFTIDTRFVYSNQGLYDEMGIGLPETWDDVFAVGEAAKSAGLEAGIGFAMGTGISGIWETSAHLGKTNNGWMLAVNDDSTATSTLSSPEIFETVEFLKRAIDEGTVPAGSLALGGGELDSLFTTHQIASWGSGNWMIATYDQEFADGEIDFDPVMSHLPMKVQRGANAGGWGWYVFNTIDDPDIGWDFVKFFLEDDNVNEGWPDSLPPGSNQMALPYYAENPKNEFVAEVLEYSTWPIAPVAGYFEIMPVMWEAISEALNGQKDIESALADGDKEVQRLLDSGHNAIVGG